MKKFLTLLILVLSACNSDVRPLQLEPSGFPTEKGTQFIVAANFPYYGIYPHVEENGGDFTYWRTMLLQLKSSGFNAIYITIPWGFHEAAPGEKDFISSSKDLRSLLRLAASYDMKVIMDISPQSAPLYNGGGLPLWLKGFLTLLPSESSDGRVAVRTVDNDFLQIYQSFLQNLISLLYPYLWSPDYPDKPVIALVVERDLDDLDFLWKETLSYLNIDIDPTSGYAGRIQSLSPLKDLTLPLLFDDTTPKRNITTASRVINTGRKNSVTVAGLTTNRPYEILNAYISGNEGVILKNFTSHYLPGKEYGWLREGYPYTLTDVSLTGNFIPEEISLASPLSVTGAQTSMILHWLQEGFFPSPCYIRRWEISYTSHTTEAEQYFFGFTLNDNLYKISRTWECLENDVEVNYDDASGLSLKIREGNLYLYLENCRILYLSRSKAPRYIVMTDSPHCTLQTNGSIETTPYITTWDIFNHSLQFQTDTIINISGGGETIQIYGFPPERLPYVHILPGDILAKGPEYALTQGSNIELLTSRTSVISHIDYPFPQPVSTLVYKSSQTEVTPGSIYYLNESNYDEIYNPEYENTSWIKGTAFDSYFTDPPYNYKSGIFWVIIPFENKWGGNGYIRLPSANGVFNVFLNGNFLGTFASYGEDVTVPFLSTQIKVSTSNHIAIMGLPMPSFPLTDPLFSLSAGDGYDTLFNFYHKVGFLGDGTITVGDHTYSLSGNWYYIHELWGERERLYSDFVNELWYKRSLPIKINPGNVVWLKTFFKTPVDLYDERTAITLSVEGEDFLALVYFNGTFMGILTPDTIKTSPLRLKIASRHIQLSPRQTEENNLTLAVVSLGEDGTITRIGVQYKVPMVERWISVP